MGAVKPTPGPWEVGGFSGTDVVIPPRKVIGPDGEPAWAVSIVASVHNPGTDDFSVWTQDKSGEHDDPVVHANTRLIASAPDLFGALADLERAATAMYRVTGASANYGHAENRFADDDPNIIAARAALAKARGES